MHIKALKDGYVIYTTDNGEIIAQPMDKSARAVLDWYSRNVPVNDNNRGNK